MSERVKELECVIADLTKQVQEARAENEKLRKRNEELLKAIIQMHREANARTDGGEGE